MFRCGGYDEQETVGVVILRKPGSVDDRKRPHVAVAYSRSWPWRNRGDHRVLSGFVAMTNGLGSIIGGLSVGPMVDRWGYPTMSLALCVFSMGLFAVGWLSDRLGRKRMMVIAYIGYALCMVTLALSSSLWHFWIVVILLKVGMVSMNVGAAYVTDIVEPKALGRGVAVSSFFGSVLPLIGIVFILLIRVARVREEGTLA